MRDERLERGQHDDQHPCLAQEFTDHTRDLALDIRSHSISTSDDRAIAAFPTSDWFAE
jgi:hypothetical protein